MLPLPVPRRQRHALATRQRPGPAFGRWAGGVLLCLLAAPLAAQSLVDLAQRALAADPAVAAAAAQLRAAEQRVVQARAGFGPNAALTGNFTDSRYREAPEFDLRPLRSKQAALQVNQPLWRGTLWPALDAAQAQQRQAQALRAQAETEAMQRFVEAAFDVLKARDVWWHAHAQRTAAAEQLLVARRAHQIGTAPLTDVYDAQARADMAAATVLATETDLTLRRQVLAELAGADAQRLVERGLDGARLPALAPQSLPQWLFDAATANPQVQQAELALAAAEAEVRKAWLGHAPTADLNWTYTRSSDNGTVTTLFPRSGNTSAIGVSVNIPLFASGATQARVHESVAQRDKALADLDAARRTVALAVRQAFASVQSAAAQVGGLETALRSQEAALRANRRAYQVGTKVNFEVLDAQSRLYEVRRDLSRARNEAWSAYLKLKSQAGQLDANALAELDAQLQVMPPPELLLPQRSRR